MLSFSKNFLKFPIKNQFYSSSGSDQKTLFELVKTLRGRTKAGIQDCRQALLDNNNDLEKAELWLQGKVKSVAEKKSSRKASEGLLALVSNLSNTRIAAVEVR